MERTKIDYGIDLGTTNSAICRMEKGEAVIIKSDTLKDVLPSCVSVNKRQSVRVGDAAYNTMKSEKRKATKSWSAATSNTYLEFKRTMATNAPYHSEYAGKDFTSEQLSAEVLKTLRAFVTDDEVRAAVVTVPAKFTVNQKTATLEAARMAGITRCELLQEPVAAAMAYGLTAEEKNGLWLVFDFGGGTFDAALLRVEDGVMQVFDTEGDNYLGGKNLDYAIVDNIIIPHLYRNYAVDCILADDKRKQILRDAMKTYAEEVKNQLSFKPTYDVLSDVGELGVDDDGEELELDLTVSQQEVFDAIRPLFQRAVDICKSLLSRNNISGSSLGRLILVGGPTHCPLLRTMLREQITPNVDVSIDPMTAVATGAALYASTLDAASPDDETSAMPAGMVRLEVDYEATSVAPQEWVTVALAAGVEVRQVQVELVRGDGSWSSGRVQVDATGNVIEAKLVAARPNLFRIECYDDTGTRLDCRPSEITIIQGSKVSAAPLPFNIGIATWSEEKHCGVFRMAQGLEKNKPLPAVGFVGDVRTTVALRPGVAADIMTVPVYQVDDCKVAEGRRAQLYEKVADVVITGDDVDRLIPIGTAVDLTLRVDASEQMTLEVSIPAYDITLERVLDTSKKHSLDEADGQIDHNLREAQRSLTSLTAEGFDTAAATAALDDAAHEAEDEPERKKVLEHTRELLRSIDDIEQQVEWQRVEHQLREAFHDIDSACQENPDKEMARLVETQRRKADEVIAKKDVALGRALLQEMRSIYFELTRLDHYRGFITYYSRCFDRVAWKDKSIARQMIDKGLRAMDTNPQVSTLQPVVHALLDLLPDDEAEKTGGLLR